MAKTNTKPAADASAQGAANPPAADASTQGAANPPAADASTKRVEPILTAVSAAVPMPKKPTAGRKGSVSLYPFDELTEVGMSFGVKNKTRKNMVSIVSNQNRNSMEPKKDANGNTIFKMGEMKDAAGNVTKVPTEEPELIAVKHFFAVDADPKTDPDGASVRVFRDK